MELKNLMILLALVLGVFVIIGVPYAEITTTYTVDGADNLALSNGSTYEAKLDNIKVAAKDGTQDANELDTTGGSTFDKLGALVEKAFSVSTQSVSTAEDSMQLLEDVEDDTSSYIPTVVFTFLAGAVFLFILYGLIKILTGR